MRVIHWVIILFLFYRETIDTLEVSGTVLAAADLEPVKGMMVGLHVDLDDSAFAKKPFDRVSRTDSRGRFTIRGIAPGKYHIFGLMDGNQNYLYDSKTEMIAFSDSIIVHFYGSGHASGYIVERYGYY